MIQGRGRVAERQSGRTAVSSPSIVGWGRDAVGHRPPSTWGSGAVGLCSEHAVCLWIPLYALRCEELRQPDLAGRPIALLAPEDSRRIWQASTRARRHGVRSGMTVSQAIGLCPVVALIEPDPVHYDEQFAHLLMRLENVSPVIEPVELGRVFVGVDGLEGLYGPPEEQLATIAKVAEGHSGRAATDHLTALPPYRLGWGRGKFTAWVAATRAKPGAPVVVEDQSRVEFLQAQPLAVLPLDPDNHRRLIQLGLRTVGDLAALPQAAIIAQFGREGRATWRLAAGAMDEPVQGRVRPQSIVASLNFPVPVADRGMLAHAIQVLTEHAIRDPRRTGWRVHTVRVRAALEQGASWMVEAMLKDPSALRERITAPLVVRLEQTPPTGAVESLAVEFSAFVRGTDELQLFARDAVAAARAGRRRALRDAAREIQTRLKRQMLYHVIEVQPWSRLPERRYALIAFEP
jgi:nucleotidyltransferase/DNA polymerase involved in DNA repair